MNNLKPAKLQIALAQCPNCPEIHLVILDSKGIKTSIPLARDEWATLIGMYTDMVVMQDRAQFEREGGRVN